jgi:hypothetical protein
MEFYDDSDPIKTFNNSSKRLSLNSVLSNTFFRMFLGLLASAVTALYAYYSGIYVTMITNGYYGVLAILEIVVVIIFSLLFKKLSPTGVTVLYFAYAFLNGFTLSVIFAAYEMTSIGYCFIGSAVLFGILAYLGYKTDKDISNWGTILTVALFIGIILTIVNLFIGSTILDVALDWFILILFFGLTVYDTNKIKQFQQMGFCEDEKLYVYGAMELYLDFINIFLRLLSIFGKRRD